MALNMSWQEWLNELQLKYGYWVKRSPGDALMHITNDMQKQFPGNYHVIDVYDSQSTLLKLDLMFDNPEEKTFWMIKWS
jgi:hypothetical protein